MPNGIGTPLARVTIGYGFGPLNKCLGVRVAVMSILRSNMALNLAPFGRWTLRDKAAQRRLALR